MDTLTAEYREANHVTCQKGCGGCCHQLVCCTTLEMELIARCMRGLPRLARRSLQLDIRKASTRFSRAFLATGRNSMFSGADLGTLMELHRDKPCIFLTSGQSCAIYPVRPVDCRIAKVKGECPWKGGTKTTEAVRLFLDQAASDLIMEEEERIHGSAQAAPLISWPTSREFADCF